MCVCTTVSRPVSPVPSGASRAPGAGSGTTSSVQSRPPNLRRARWVDLSYVCLALSENGTLSRKNMSYTALDTSHGARAAARPSAQPLSGRPNLRVA